MPEPGAPQITATDVRQGLHYQQLRDRFPVLDGRDRADRGAARPVHLPQPVRAADDRQQDRRGAARSALVRRLPAGAGGLPAARQPAERISRSRGLAPHQRRPRAAAGVALPARDERLAAVRDSGRRRAHRAGRAGPGPAPGALRRGPGGAGRHGRRQRALDPLPPGSDRAVPAGRPRRHGPVVDRHRPERGRAELRVPGHQLADRARGGRDPAPGAAVRLVAGTARMAPRPPPCATPWRPRPAR